ncbi:BTB/POZ-like domain and BTB/POZ fold domain and BTB/POZ domain-containing protein [Strongyloides ratti]|uniref:BTB/POZ-like domain and BTB/POZ fold domain and BTB/POZ domain-containing protein n=1 Tax=Strongyloides ratti TaxID=34506 RepID=A0A090LFD0_STRRB|nr:BTB/POZ-like domain and BTB/POZ fold domain and BTB/POZ domain-containing protein [Strongyloides ratti]CEF68477.1 BTB/POZ-like domain and BTB/POZ fold domain and BTB/POZ domain-containing protein [Strongyloides ratti]
MSYFEKNIFVNTFSEPSIKRQYRIFADGEVFYVNGYYLAELSPYFETLFFNNCFIEARTKTVFFDSIDSWELHIFLDYICPVDNRSKKKNITVDNFHILMYFSNRFLIREFEDSLIHFLKNNHEACRMKLSCSKLLVLASFLRNSNSPKEFLQFCFESIALYPEEDVTTYLNMIPEDNREFILNQCNKVRIRIMEKQLDKTQDDYDIRDEHLRSIINCTDNKTNYILSVIIIVIIYTLWLM